VIFWVWRRSAFVLLKDLVDQGADGGELPDQPDNVRPDRGGVQGLPALHEGQGTKVYAYVWPLGLFGFEAGTEPGSEITGGYPVACQLAEFESMDIVEELVFPRGLIGYPYGEEYAAAGREGGLPVACPFRFICLERDGVQDGAGEKKEIAGHLFPAFLEGESKVIEVEAVHLLRE
jgi:hypothetical protein